MRLNKTMIKKDWFIGLVITLLFLIAAEAEWFSTLDTRAYNLGARFSASKDAHEDVVVLAIDEKSINAIGPWPWSREVLAEATLLLGRAAPQVIGFNLPLDHPQHRAGIKSLGNLRNVLKRENKLSRNVNKALRLTESTLRSDDKLAGSFKSAGRIVLGMTYIEAEARQEGLIPSLPKHMGRFALDKVRVDHASRGFGWPNPDVVDAGTVFPPLEAFTRRVGAVGVMSQDVFNGEPLVVRYGSEVLPSFPLMVTTRSKGLSMKHIETLSQVSPMLGGKDLGADSDQKIYPRYYEGKDGKSAFRVYSLIDLLDASVPMATFKDKIVLIGLTSEHLANRLPTPDGESIPGTIAAAHTVSSLLNNEQFRLPDWVGWAQRGLILVLGLYLMFVVGRFRANTAFFLSLFLVLMIFNAHFLLMSMQAVWLPMMTAVVMLIIGHLAVGARKAIKAYMENTEAELYAANRQLGMALQAQGNLDQAFEKYRQCIPDQPLLGQVYNLGLDYERKRQFNKAGAVFDYILQHDPDYNDVAERSAQVKKAANTVVLGGRDNTGPGPNLIASQDGVQKPKLGRYQIDSEIGRGAMGMVYLGRDDKIGRTVAIKTMLLSDEIEEDLREEVRTRFFREAEAAGRLDHPNIVTVYDVGEEQDLAYIAMDYLKGKDLTAYCTGKSLLPANQVFDVIGSVALALDYAHKQHVVHRDIKPANIIYDQEKGVAKITDFGVACLTDASKTKTGTILGSPFYMSPEQLAGKKVDGRADLYSLGVTLYQMLSGVLPFNGESIANLMYNIANEPHPDLLNFRADLPKCVGTLIDTALHKEAAKRFQSGKQMAAVMQACQQQIREMNAA